MKKINSDTAYAVLLMHIKALEKRNDTYAIRNIEQRKLFDLLTSEQKKSIIDKSTETYRRVTNKLHSGGITPDAAYDRLCTHIEDFEKCNDTYHILNIEECELFEVLIPDQKNSVIEKSEQAYWSVINKLCSGKITPMMLNDASRTRSAYIYYLRYLRDTVLKEDHVKAEKLAEEVYTFIQTDDYITDKHYFDEDYFSVLFSTERKNSNVPEIEIRSGFFDKALHKGKAYRSEKTA